MPKEVGRGGEGRGVSCGFRGGSDPDVINEDSALSSLSPHEAAYSALVV